jgi:hypothetical protein
VQLSRRPVTAPAAPPPLSLAFFMSALQPSVRLTEGIACQSELAASGRRVQGGLRSRGAKTISRRMGLPVGTRSLLPSVNGRCGKRRTAAAKGSSSCTDLIDSEASVGVRPPVAVAFLVSRVTGRSIRRP